MTATHWPRVKERALTAPHLPIALYLIWVGGDAWHHPVQSEVAGVPIWFVYTWATALILGGLLIITGTLTASARTESGGHAAHLVGLTIYAALATAAGLFGTGLVVVIATLAAVSGIRLRTLARSREARELAGHIVQGEL